MTSKSIILFFKPLVSMPDFSSENIKKSSSSLFYIDFILIFLIIFSSFLVYFHHLVPDRKEWDIFLVTLSPKITPTVQAFFYHTLIKITPIIFFSIWFVTESHWWRYSILIPVSIVSFQLVSNVIDDFTIINNGRFYEVFLVGIYLLLIVLINNYLKYHRFNIGAKFNIDSDNLYLIPSSKENNDRLDNIKSILDQENLNRSQLNTIYREYSYLNETSFYLKNSDGNDYSQSYIPKLVLEILLFGILSLTPILLYVHNFVQPGLKVVNLFGVDFPSFGFPDIRTLLWVINSKIILIIPVSLWFFSNRHWWKYFLLIPFAVGLFQLLEIFGNNSEVDSYKFYNLFPIILLLSGIMVLLTRRFRNYVILAEFYNTMEGKINNTIRHLSLQQQSEKKKKLKQELMILIQNHKNYLPEEYLQKLKAIKKRLEELSQE